MSSQNPTANQTQQSGNTQNNLNTLKSRFSGSGRFNNNNTKSNPLWTITSLSRIGTRIAYSGLGDPLFRILGTQPDKALSAPQKFVDKLEENIDLRMKLLDKLDQAWEQYNIRGATILHPVRRNIQDAFTKEIMPISDIQSPESENGDETTPSISENTQPTSNYQTYRAIDALFVLNILGRVRGNVLVDGTPIALELGFLQESYICDDPRIVDVVLATGSIEESW